MVAEWPFCMECFHGLMEKPARRSSSTERLKLLLAKPEKKEAAVAVFFEQTRQRCTLCEKEIEGDRY